MPAWLNAILESTNPLWKLAALALVVGGTFAATWLSLRLSHRRLQRQITAMTSEAWVELLDAVDPKGE